MPLAAKIPMPQGAKVESKPNQNPVLIKRNAIVGSNFLVSNNKSKNVS